MSYQVISVKDNKECLECTKETYNEALEFMMCIEKVLEISGWYIKRDSNNNKIWEVKG